MDAGQASGAVAAAGRIDQRLLKALCHPLRAQMLTILNDRTSSPSDLAVELGVALSDASYHVRELLRLEQIELVGTAPRRGAVEHYYRGVRGAGGHASWTPMMLDETGWAELRKLLEETRDRALGLQERASLRFSSGESEPAIAVNLGIVGFEATPGDR